MGKRAHAVYPCPRGAPPEPQIRDCAAITAPISTTAGFVTVGASCGVLVLESWGGVPATGTVLKHADQAMYHAKRAGGGTHLFDPDEPLPYETQPPSSRIDEARR